MPVLADADEGDVDRMLLNQLAEPPALGLRDPLGIKVVKLAPAARQMI